MTCEPWWEFISAGLDGELSASEQSALEAHLRVCGTCAERRRVAARAHRRTRLYTAPAIPDLVPNVLDRPRRVGGLVAGVVAVAAATIVGLVLAGPGGDPRSAPVVRVASARPAARGGASVIYLDVENRGGADEVVAATSPVAASIEFHRAVGHAGEAIMDTVTSVRVPAHSGEAFAAVNTHVMLEGLSISLRPGDIVPVRLVFARAGVVDVQAVVSA